MFRTQNIYSMQRPWNLPSYPVYSLTTYSGDQVNMNVCTYVSALSMNPKIIGIALYENTKTLDNMLNSEMAILQLLHKDQFPLVRMLGKKSGLHWDKDTWLHKKERTTLWLGYPVLANCSAYMELKKKDNLKTGDHTLFLFEVKRFKSCNSDLLTTQILSEKKIIRI